MIINRFDANREQEGKETSVGKASTRDLQLELHQTF